jgi:hypothetical protein
MQLGFGVRKVLTTSQSSTAEGRLEACHLFHVDGGVNKKSGQQLFRKIAPASALNCE